MSLRSVATSADVSPSLLSQIERGEASPSLTSLVAIADALLVRPGLLLDDLESEPHESPVVRKKERRIIDDPRCRREYLMHPEDPYLEFAELTLAPGSVSRPALARHPGRDYGLVLSGEIIVEFEDGREVLKQGDYVAFDAENPHRLANETGKPARIIWIVANGRREADR